MKSETISAKTGILPLTSTGKTPPPLIAGFLESYLGNTIYSYRGGILDFFDYINGERIRGKRGATDEDMVKYEALATEYLSSERDYSSDFLRYIKHLKEEGIPPKTANIRYVSVTEFFRRYDIKIDDKRLRDARRLKPKGGRRTNIEFADKKILGEILHHCDARFRAFILFLSSSGCRLGEAMNVRWGDISFPDRNKYPQKPASVFIRDSKTGYSRTTFITRECETALLEWRKVEKKYTEFARKRSENLKNPVNAKRIDPNMVFDLARTTIYENWDRCLKDAGYYHRDDVTGRVRLNVHRLRNFFSVQVASSAGLQVSEMLLGHADGYQGAYSGRSIDQLESEYMKAEPHLTIGTTSGETQIQLVKLAEQERIIAGLKERLAQVEKVQQYSNAIRSAASEYIGVDDIERIVQAKVEDALKKRG